MDYLFLNKTIKKSENRVKPKRITWIAWEKHRRTLELCKYIGIKPIIFESYLSRVVKHPFFIISTIYLLFRQAPSILIVQNPSIILTYLACLLKNKLRYYLIVDSHNGGLIPDGRFGIKLKFIYSEWQKLADLTVVTNNSLAEIVRKNGGKSNNFAR